MFFTFAMTDFSLVNACPLGHREGKAKQKQSQCVFYRSVKMQKMLPLAFQVYSVRCPRVASKPRGRGKRFNRFRKSGKSRHGLHSSRSGKFSGTGKKLVHNLSSLVKPYFKWLQFAYKIYIWARVWLRVH
jgi:hypothetical protein